MAIQPADGAREPSSKEPEGKARRFPLSAVIIGVLAGLLSAGQYLVFPCTVEPWAISFVSGLVFFFYGLRFLFLLAYTESWRASRRSLWISLVILPLWLFSHMCP